MPIDPYAALNAMLRAEVTRFTPPARQTEPAEPAEPPKAQAMAVVVAVESESEPQQKAADSAA
ncbi:hypothetical protein [Streptomyces sp. NBC_01233]|uniref:hypothetical protein n=1 Tax=Streptomyces sp. NBC_01233 TaxID=2903787 RepID=UPI002E146AEA|nr:hypothetical protein OG332_22430 [Streptomyces sp. NBC_01233]